MSIEITVYIHIFIHHLWEMMKNLNSVNINLFTLEGLEKLNDMITQYYFRSTNRRKNHVKQIFQKRNRIEQIIFKN